MKTSFSKLWAKIKQRTRRNSKHENVAKDLPKLADLEKRSANARGVDILKRFNEEKSTSIAAEFLILAGGTMNYMKLLKLLYTVERQALIKWGALLTDDQAYSLDRGPVLSSVYDLIRENPIKNETGIWHEHIRKTNKDSYDVELFTAMPSRSLSKTETDLIHETFTTYQTLDQYSVSLLTHDFPEWQDPKGSSIPISDFEILTKAGKTPEEAAAILEDNELHRLADDIFADAKSAR